MNNQNDHHKSVYSIYLNLLLTKQILLLFAIEEGQFSYFNSPTAPSDPNLQDKNPTFHFQIYIPDFLFYPIYLQAASQKTIMHSGYSSPTQNKTYHYTSPSIKPSSPSTKHQLAHGTPSTKSNKDLSMKKEEFKELKFLNNFPGNFTPTNKKTPITSPNKQQFLKTPQSQFFESKNLSVKGPMYASDSSVQGLQKHKRNYFDEVKQQTDEKPKKMVRMSQAPRHDMKGSMQLSKDVKKVPTFLQGKQSKGQDIGGKKVPFSIHGIERPQSTKESVNKEEMLTDQSLNSSFGFSKQLKIDEANELDAKSEWIKKSWSKKKQKKYSLNDFDQIKELGIGKYGHVFLVREKKSNFVCALKIIEKKLLQEEEITEQFIRQLKIQTFLVHPNIIRMFGFFDDATKIYIILEVGTGGQLFKQLKTHQCMPEAKVASIVRQICQAVNELHSNRIIHRDIKPQNIVLHENVFKLCDFGWSVRRDEKLRKTFCGTPLYVCPQILRGKEYDEKIDIWSLGVMTYEMLVGQNPFKITKEQELIKIIKDNINIPSYVEISPEAKNFLDSCLQKNPEQRLNIRELLNHEFFRKYPDKNDKKHL